MTDGRFIRFLKDIWNIPEDKLKDYASALENKVNNHHSKTKRDSLRILLIIASYYLISNAVIDTLKVGPFQIKDVNLILDFAPLAVALMINNASSNFYTAYYSNFFLSVVYRKYYGLKENTALLTSILPMKTEHAAIHDDENSSAPSLGSCLFQIPIALVFFLIILLVIPFYYYFALSAMFESYGRYVQHSIWTFWIPNIIAIVYLLLGIKNGGSLFRFMIRKTVLLDQENKKRKQA